jgi:formimidoylglutamate deiminase
MRLFAPDALTPRGWERDVAIDIDAHGVISRIEVGARRDGAETVAGPLVPGMPNLHSHAFQRAIAGRTGRAGASGDSFWTWRETMYAFLDRIDADAFEAIAAQAYVEMLKAGYTAVAEFHYVHHDPQGNPYADPAELAHRIVAAAGTSGIALTLLPVFYAHADFGGVKPTEGTAALRAYARYVRAGRGRARTRSHVGRLHPGIAPHSLRAVTPGELIEIVSLIPRGSPIHIHAAEQLREVAACIAWSGARPVEWLLTHAGLDARWCVVHATHMTDDETQRLAASGAIAGLAPTTEADLGDGTFAARRYVEARGAFGVGSDSNTCIDPFAELRQLEWSQRLAGQARNVLAAASVPVGQALYTAAALGGARALRRPAAPLPRVAVPISWCSIPTSRHSRRSRLRPCSMPPCSARVALPCAMSWSEAAGSCATGITRGRTPCSPIIATVLRACRHESGVRPADHGNAPRDDGGRGALWRHS